MKIKFKNYEYFNPNDTDNSSNKAFDESYYDGLLADNRYTDAADYLSNYRFNDPATQRQHQSDIQILRRRGAELQAIYGRISNKDDKDKIELYNKVFANNGLSSINTVDKTQEDYNPYAAELIEAKDKLGKHDSRDDYSDKIGIVFKPKKRSRFGLDWLAADNPYDIDYFYNKTGFTKQALINSGIEVIEKDGTTELKFSKSHPLANKILYETPTESDIATDYASYSFLSGVSTALESATFGLASLGAFGKENPTNTSSFSVSRAYAPLVVGYTTDGSKIYNDAGGVENHFMFQDLERFKSIIRNAENTKDKTFENLNLDKKGYTSTMMPWISDELHQLRESVPNDEEYNKLAKDKFDHIFDAIGTLSSSNYVMYSNITNDNNDETLVELGDADRYKMANILSAAKPSELRVGAMVVNGEVGAVVTVAAKYKQTGEDIGKLIHPRYQVFIPGLLTNEAQERLNNDTKSIAIQQLNSMMTWDYNYRLSTGDEIGPGLNGEFTKNGKPISKDQAIQELNKDIALTQMRNELKYIHTGLDGKTIKKDQYKPNCENAALAIAAELYPGRIGLTPNSVDHVVINGDVYSIEDIYSHNIDIDEVNYDTHEMLQNIYDMYNTLMSDLIYYNK